MTVNLLSRNSVQELGTELCSLIEFVLNYDFKKKHTKERELSGNENLQETEKEDGELLDSKAVVYKNLERIDSRITVGSNELHVEDRSCLSKSHFSNYSKCRSDISAVYEPYLKQKSRCTRMMPYKVPLYCSSSSNGRSSGKRSMVDRDIRSLDSVSDHHQSIHTSSKRTNNMDDRFCKDNIQELIFKIYSEQQTLDELLRCKTHGHYRPCKTQADVLEQSSLVAPAPPRFLTKTSVFNAPAKPDICLQIPDLLKVPEGGECKEELFNALHVPYFEEKRIVARQLDDLFSTKLGNRINFI